MKKQPEQTLSNSEARHLAERAHLACQLLNGQRLIIDNQRKKIEILEKELEELRS